MKWWGWGDEDVSFTHDDKPELRGRSSSDPSARRRPRAPAPVAFERSGVPEAALPGRLRAALETRSDAEHVSDRPARPRRACARQEPARPRRQRRGELGRMPDVVVRPGRRGRGRRGRCAPPSTRTRSSSRSAAARASPAASRPRRRDAARDLHRPRPPEPGARDRRRRRDWRACRPASSAPTSRTAQRSGLDGRPLPRHLHALDAGRLDRDALLGDAVRPLRRHRRPHARAARGHARRACWSSRRCRARRPARACARWCWAARAGWGSSPRRRSTSGACRPAAPDPRLFVPDLGGGLGRHARPRRQRGVAVGDACVRRPRDRVLVRHAKAPSPLDRVKSKALQAFLERRRGFDLEAMCLSFIGYEGTATTWPRSASAVGRIVARHGGLCIGQSPGELYDQKKFDTPYIRDFLLDRGALGDVSETAGAVERAARRSTTTSMAAAPRRLRRARRPRLCDVPPVALLPRGCLPLLHLRVQAAGPARRPGGLRRREVRDPAGLRGHGATLSTTTRSAPSTPSGSRRTSRPPVSPCCGRSSRAPTPGRTSTREDRRDRSRRRQYSRPWPASSSPAPAASSAARCRPAARARRRAGRARALRCVGREGRGPRARGRPRRRARRGVARRRDGRLRARLPRAPA